MFDLLVNKKYLSSLSKQPAVAFISILFTADKLKLQSPIESTQI